MIVLQGGDEGQQLSGKDISIETPYFTGQKGDATKTIQGKEISLHFYIIIAELHARAWAEPHC